MVLGETRHYNFEMIQRAAAFVSRGAPFIATNRDVAEPAGRPSCGAFAAPIEDLERFAYRPDHVVKDAFALREVLERGV